MKGTEKDIVSRLVDANLNRCREGLRVVEDTLRFIYRKNNLYLRCRRIRHSLDKIFASFWKELVRSRSPQSDPGGKEIEPKRKNILSLLIANFRRAEEAFRVLEEYAKIFSPKIGFKFKRLRFRIYRLEKEVMLALKQ